MVNMINPNQPVMHGLRSQTYHQPFWIQDGTPASWPNCQASADLQKMSGTSAQRLQPSIASMVGSQIVQGQGADSYVFHEVSCSKYLDDISGW